MTLLAEIEATFTYHVDDLFDFFTETFDEHCGSKDLALAYLKTLRKIEVKCDVEDIRTATDQDFNPGPFVIVGVPITLDEEEYSLLPSIGGWGRGNETATLGLVTAARSEIDVPNHASGFRRQLENAPERMPYEITYNRTAILGTLAVPSSLKGYVVDLSTNIIGTFLEFLSLGFGEGFLAEGANAFEKEKTKVEPFVKKMWKHYLDQADEALAYE